MIMKKRKGFTFIEVLIALILLGLVSGFFATVYTHSYKLDRVNKHTITTSYQGQELIEDKITLTAGQAQDYADFILSGSATPSPNVVIPRSNVSMWGSNVLGYDVREVVVDKDSDRSATIDIYSFVYANARRPAIPMTTFVTPASKNVAPKFRYLEEYQADPRKYAFAVQIDNIGSVRRAVTREYIGNKNIDFAGDKYVSRPYSDFFSGDNYLDETTFYHAPYISKYPIGYGLLSKDKEASKGKVVMDAEGKILDDVTNLEYEASFDNTEKEKYRDVGVLHTFQTQAVSGYTEDEKAILDSATWLVGTPIISGLEAQWDANLVYKNIKLDTSVDTVSRDIVSLDQNMILADPVADPRIQVAFNSVTQLLDRTETHAAGILGEPWLFVKGIDSNEFNDPNAAYRKYSAGIQLLADSSKENRIRLQDIGKPSLGNGRDSYSIIIRAKQIDPSLKSSLFSINMNSEGAINNVSAPNNEANQFYIDQGSIGYIADRGIGVQDPSIRRHISPAALLHQSVYNSFAANDERKDYHIYELQITNTGPADSYRLTVLVDGKKIYLANAGSPEWCDLDQFGLELGENLEISDILIYSRNLSPSESLLMSNYLLFKYTVSDDERLALENNLAAI